MEEKKYLIEGLVIILSLSVFYVLKNYLPKYFEAKAANQATKEDIGEITEVVENIKSDLAQQTEMLKAQRSLDNQHRLNLKNSERDAIFDFNKQKSVWIYSLMRFSFYGYELQNYKEVNTRKYLEIEQRQYEFELATAHLELFVYDGEFIVLKGDLFSHIIELHKVVLDTTYKLFYAFSKTEIEMVVEKDKPLELARIRNELNEELLGIQKKYREATAEQFKKVERVNFKMRDLLYKRLKNLENEQ
ncbi:hypothetical protein [Pedobacter chitinilyticus]|uniref:Uncharacterized protein n=1 Tax=Pedobacter chitinilyticus TaxID=2233776 RepID=A0A3S3PVY1_9SPHI|nr:hypothetical protein [Pedobacter chitinilyticus]RWU10646.1 hypothetical protein DPV69_04720 [Pedobacter chitinilyticus]